MKKKLLALLLAAMMILSVLPAVASAETTTIGNEDNTTGFWSAFSDYYTIQANSYQTFTFKNYTSKGAVWDNYMVILSTVAERGANGYTEYVLMRADNFGWGGSYSTATNIIREDVNLDKYDGADVTVTIVNRNGKADIYSVVTNGDYKNFRHCGNITTDTGAIQAFFSIEAGHLSQMTPGSQVTMTDGPILGALDNYTYGRLAASDTWSVNPGYEKTIRFHNYSDKVAAWNNCLIGLNTKNGVWHARIDNWVEDADATYQDNAVNKEIDASNAGFEAFNWDALKAHMDNTEVTATVKNDGETATVTISAYNENTEKTFVQIYKSVPLDDNSNISFFLTNGAGNHVVLNEVKENVKIAPFVQASLTLSDRIGLNFELSGKLDGLKAVIDDGEPVAIPANGIVTKSFAAKDFQTDATLKLVDADGNPVQFYKNGELVSSATTNVKAMCEAYEEQYKDNANVSNVAHYMRIYCSLASNYFEKTSIDVSDDQQYLNAMGDALVADNDIKISQDAEWTAESMYLTLEDQIIMTVVLSKGEGTNKETSTWKVRGIEPKNLLAEQNNLEYGLISVVPMFYGKLVLQDESGEFNDVKDVVKALYCYALACKEYVPAA